MKFRHREQATAAVKTKAIAAHQKKNRRSRREVLAGSAAVGTTILTGAPPAAAETTTRPETGTRLAGLIAQRQEARKNAGPVRVLDAGDYSMGTTFTAAIRETGGELHLRSRMGYDAARQSG